MSACLSQNAKVGKTLIASTDFETFLFVSDQKVLEVKDACHYAEGTSISMEDVKALFETDFEPNKQSLKLITYRISSKHQTHVPSRRLETRETDY
jgi:hypothetical protein